MNELEKLRKVIDDIDKRIIALLRKRIAASKKIGKEKKSLDMKIEDKKREKIVIEKIKKEAKKSGLNEETAENIYKLILKDSKEKQR